MDKLSLAIIIVSVSLMFGIAGFIDANSRPKQGPICEIKNNSRVEIDCLRDAIRKCKTFK